MRNLREGVAAIKARGSITSRCDILILRLKGHVLVVGAIRGASPGGQGALVRSPTFKGGILQPLFGLTIV